jgi:molybdopterin converting factor subunit 1
MIMLMKIHIRYFASFRELTGRNEEILDTPEGASVAEVRELLLERYPNLQAVMARATCAVNRKYVSAETELHEGDEMVFIPPVGGGCPSQEELVWNL